MSSHMVSGFSTIRGILNNLARGIRSTVTDELAVEIGGNNIDAFGDVVMHNYTPVLQFDFVYGGGGTNGIYDSTNQQVGRTASSGTGASVSAGSAASSLLSLVSGTSAGNGTTNPNTGYAFFQSVRILRYRPGQAMLVRFTSIYTTGVAGNYQIVGAGNTIDGYFFGYNETAFGILHRRNSSDADPNGGWTAKTSWNVDVCDGTNSSSNPSGFNLDPTKGNIYQIRYPYLGFGPIKFYVLDSRTSLWVLVHVIKYPNTYTAVQITNPGLQFFAATFNGSSGSTGTTLKLGSVGAFLSGEQRFLGPQFGVNNTKSITTETNVVSVRNATTYNGVTNRGIIRIRSISISSDGGNGTATLKVYKGATLGGSPAYTPVSGSTVDNGASITSGLSIGSFDTAGTTVANGVVIFNSTLARATNFTMDTSSYELNILPGEIMTFSMASSGSAASNSVAVNWQEDQ